VHSLGFASPQLSGGPLTRINQGPAGALRTYRLATRAAFGGTARSAGRTERLMVPTDLIGRAATANTNRARPASAPRPRTPSAATHTIHTHTAAVCPRAVSCRAKLTRGAKGVIEGMEAGITATPAERFGNIQEPQLFLNRNRRVPIVILAPRRPPANTEVALRRRHRRRLHLTAGAQPPARQLRSWARHAA
jgi:hypothetical protein